MAQSLLGNSAETKIKFSEESAHKSSAQSESRMHAMATQPTVLNQYGSNANILDKDFFTSCLLWDSYGAQSLDPGSSMRANNGAVMARDGFNTLLNYMAVKGQTGQQLYQKVTSITLDFNPSVSTSDVPLNFYTSLDNLKVVSSAAKPRTFASSLLAGRASGSHFDDLVFNGDVTIDEGSNVSDVSYDRNHMKGSFAINSATKTLSLKGAVVDGILSINPGLNERGLNWNNVKAGALSLQSVVIDGGDISSLEATQATINNVTFKNVVDIGDKIKPGELDKAHFSQSVLIGSSLSADAQSKLSANNITTLSGLTQALNTVSSYGHDLASLEPSDRQKAYDALKLNLPSPLSLRVAAEHIKNLAAGNPTDEQKAFFKARGLDLDDKQSLNGVIAATKNFDTQFTPDSAKNIPTIASIAADMVNDAQRFNSSAPIIASAPALKTSGGLNA